MTLTEFLNARLGEDEAVAKAATAGPWEWVPGDEGWTSQGPDLMSTTATWTLDEYGPYPSKVIGAWGHDAWGINVEDADAAHVVRHDPARVLREVEAKRKILAECERLIGGGYIDDGEAVVAEFVVRALAAVYSDHPDYDPAWA